MKRLWKKTMSVILVAVLMIGLIPLQSTAVEPVRLPEDNIVEETAESGAFYLASSAGKLSENSPAPYYLRVARGGNVLPAAELRLEMMDISAKYGEDYTVSSVDGAKVENADAGTSLMEAFASGNYEEAMVDDNGNDLSLTDAAAEKEAQNAANDIGDKVGSAIDEYVNAKASEDGIDLEALADSRKLAVSVADDPQSELSRAFEEQTGLIDDRTPIQNNGDNSELNELLYAGYGLGALNDMASSLDVPSLTLRFAEGEKEKGILITVKNNDKAEGDKMMVGKLVSDTDKVIVAEVYSGFTMTVTDDEKWEAPTIAFSAAEYSPEGGYAMVSVSREGLSTMVSTVHMTSSDDTAKNGRDYSKVDTDVVFPCGVNERVVKIPVRSDYLDDEARFSLTLSDPVGATLGSEKAVVTIPEDAESYAPQELAQTGAAATFGDIITDTPIDLSSTASAGAGSGYSKMDGSKYSLNADTMVYDSTNAYASWWIGPTAGYSGVQIDWQKTSGKPTWSDNIVKLREYNQTAVRYEDQTRLHNSEERFSRTTVNLFSGSPLFNRVYIETDKSGGIFARAVTLDIHSIKPIYRPFEIQLEQADTSALRFINKDGELTPYSQIADLQYIGETRLEGGNLKYIKDDANEITVVVNDPGYCWIKALEVLKYDSSGNIIDHAQVTGVQPQGSRSASFKLNASVLDSLDNMDMVRYEKNSDSHGSYGLKGRIGVRAVLEPYPIEVTVEDQGTRAGVELFRPKNVPKNRGWYKGDYLQANVAVDSAYQSKYYALGVEAHIYETENDNEKVRHWDYEIGKNYVSERLIYSKYRLKPWIAEKSNMLLVKIRQRNLTDYDTTRGFFKTAKQLPADDPDYLYYVIADEDSIKPNQYYELEAYPKGEYDVAVWRPATGSRAYSENTFYFQASIDKDENIINLQQPTRGDSYLNLTGTAFYSGTALDKRSEGEAWLPAEGALIFSDPQHYAVVDKDGRFSVEPTHEGQLPLYCVEGDSITYKVISGGNVQYYSTVASGKRSGASVKADLGKLKVPATDESRPYIASAVAADAGGVTTSFIPIDYDGISSVDVTVNNCGAAYDDGKKEKTKRVELLAYHPSNSESILLAALDKTDKDDPYEPKTKDNSEIWSFRLSFDGAYTDEEGVSHQGLAKSRPQLAQAKGTIYLFWQQGADDAVWLDLGELIANKTDKDTGAIDTENLPVRMVFYPTYGSQITPTYSNFEPFVDELDNLYLIWTQAVTENDVVKQELYASSLKSEKQRQGCVSRSENRSCTGFEPHSRRSWNRTSAAHLTAHVPV